MVQEIMLGVNRHEMRSNSVFKNPKDTLTQFLTLTIVLLPAPPGPVRNIKNLAFNCSMNLLVSVIGVILSVTSNVNEHKMSLNTQMTIYIFDLSCFMNSEC